MRALTLLEPRRGRKSRGPRRNEVLAREGIDTIWPFDSKGLIVP